jgi:hypothetical protein
MAHMVSAFVQANQMVFGQVKTDGKAVRSPFNDQPIR